MACYLGIDTSNYTTSCAIYDDIADTVIQRKKLLPVKSGELGLRQSDAVFHHTVQLPKLICDLFFDFNGEINAVGVSEVPVRQEGSYMPCFLPGVSAATAVACVNKIDLYKYSHQQGHLMAALYSAGKRELYGNEFLAFHVSGGTTQLLRLILKQDRLLTVWVLCLAFRFLQADMLMSLHQKVIRNIKLTLNSTTETVIFRVLKTNVKKCSETVKIKKISAAIV